jgi:hypothetical protein
VDTAGSTVVKCVVAIVANGLSNVEVIPFGARVADFVILAILTTLRAGATLVEEQVEVLDAVNAD